MNKDCSEKLPQRIQRRRTKGYRMPPNTVFVGRPTKWGNIFIAQPKKAARNSMIDMTGKIYIRVPTVADAVRCFDVMVNEPKKAEFREAIKTELRGKNLACFCKLDSPCHADILLKIANED